VGQQQHKQLTSLEVADEPKREELGRSKSSPLCINERTLNEAHRYFANGPFASIWPHATISGLPPDSRHEDRRSITSVWAMRRHQVQDFATSLLNEKYALFVSTISVYVELHARAQLGDARDLLQ
jgi:hypothetical protein